jgi:hypothetical protein
MGKRHEKHREIQLSERTSGGQYQGGPVYIFGREARFRAGKGIAKQGDRFVGKHGPVHVLVRDGRPVDGDAPRANADEQREIRCSTRVDDSEVPWS